MAYWIGIQEECIVCDGKASCKVFDWYDNFVGYYCKEHGRIKVEELQSQERAEPRFYKEKIGE